GGLFAAACGRGDGWSGAGRGHAPWYSGPCVARPRPAPHAPRGGVFWVSPAAGSARRQAFEVEPGVGRGGGQARATVAPARGGTGPCSLVQWPLRRTAPSRPACTAWGDILGFACGGLFAAACVRGGAWSGAGRGHAPWYSGPCVARPRPAPHAPRGGIFWVSPAAGFSRRHAVEVMAGVGRDGAMLLGTVALASHGPVPPRMHRGGGYFGFRLRRAVRGGRRSRWSLEWGGAGARPVRPWPLRGAGRGHAPWYSGPCVARPRPAPHAPRGGIFWVSPAAGFSRRHAFEVEPGVGRDGAMLLGTVALASHGPVPPRMHRVGGYFGFRL